MVARERVKAHKRTPKQKRWKRSKLVNKSRFAERMLNPQSPTLQNDGRKKMKLQNHTKWCKGNRAFAETRSRSYPTPWKPPQYPTPATTTTTIRALKRTLALPQNQKQTHCIRYIHTYIRVCIYGSYII